MEVRLLASIFIFSIFKIYVISLNLLGSVNIFAITLSRSKALLWSQRKGNMDGLTYQAQAFAFTEKGLELIQFRPAQETEGKGEFEYNERLSATYQNGKLISKVVP